MNSDYILIFLFILVLLLIFLSMKYFKVLLFYLWMFLWIFLSIFWKSILQKSWFDFQFLNNLGSHFSNFFSDSNIIKFFTENIKLVLFLTIGLLFYKISYYIILILLHFIKWSTINILDWISNKKEKRKSDNVSNKNSI